MGAHEPAGEFAPDGLRISRPAKGDPLLVVFVEIEPRFEAAFEKPAH
jgi:hypothetical protein